MRYASLAPRTIGMCVGMFNQWGEYDTREQFEEEFPDFMEKKRASLMLVTLNPEQHKNYKVCLKEQGFKLVGKDNGIHGHPVYLWMKTKK